MPVNIRNRRRAALKAIGASALMAATRPHAQAPPAALGRRAIPRTGETLPAIGLGTWLVFDVAPGAPEYAELREVLKTFIAGGGSVVDSSPMYGRAEATVGVLTEELSARKSLFLATKVWTSGRAAGIEQMRDSLRLLRTRTIDLMQVHNLLDAATHLATLREWKQAGTLRYIGITHYNSSAYPALEKLLAARDIDFVQFNYSLAEREAEARLLPAAAATGTAVIVNRPFAQGALFARVKGRELPPWAAEIDCTSWAQFFLKYIVAHPAVTCAIPGTGKVSHIVDNLQAGSGRLPDAKQRRRMAELIAGI